MKINKIYVSAIFVAAAVFIIATVPVRASKTDNRIESAAKSSYVFKTYLKNDDIKIESKDGSVTLTGTVSDESHRTMAGETISSLPGVKSVLNQITITGEPVAVSSDAWVAQRVRGSMLFHRSVSYINTDVSVAQGKVTLRGEASSEAQKQLTGEYAKDISGVIDVDNQMTVAKNPAPAPAKSSRTTGEVIDDASITTQVRMTLLFHHGTDVFDTKVSTHKGVVTLAGTAKNQAEIDLATKRVNDIHGVEKVVNQMTIEAAQSSTN
ncbi:MAG: BON domain-containing protein [Candidatus Zixiibacteriota bacterium]